MNSSYTGAPEQAQPLITADVSELQLNLSFSVKKLNRFCLGDKNVTATFQVCTPPATGEQEGQRSKLQNDITEPILWNIFLVMYLPSSHTPLTLQWSSGSLGCMGGETFRGYLSSRD